MLAKSIRCNLGRDLVLFSLSLALPACFSSSDSSVSRTSESSGLIRTIFDTVVGDDSPADSDNDPPAAVG